MCWLLSSKITLEEWIGGKSSKFTTIGRIHLASTNSSGEYELVIGAPATEREIDAIATTLNFKFPSEFVEFYSVMNGFGIQSPDNRLEWFFLPLSKLPEAHADTKNMLESHPDAGERFFPFVDWLCGDFTGYLAPIGGASDSRLFMLEHEELRFDPDQDPNEFLFLVHNSIGDLLTPDE